jgi:hypothetical protein
VARDRQFDPKSTTSQLCFCHPLDNTKSSSDVGERCRNSQVKEELPEKELHRDLQSFPAVSSRRDRMSIISISWYSNCNRR